MFDTRTEEVIDESAGSAAPYVVHHQTSRHYDFLGDDIYFPINHRQFRGLIGQILTHLDAMGLPDRTRRATKTLLTQDAWLWWNEACDNATTSYRGAIAPIVMRGPRVKDGPGNRWGWASEEEFLKATPELTADPYADEDPTAEEFEDAIEGTPLPIAKKRGVAVHDG